MVSTVNFVTFNELTLPLPNVNSGNSSVGYETKISDFLYIIDYLSKNYSINKIRMEQKFTELVEFVQGKPLQQILGNIKNQTLKSLLLSFIANKTINIESPLIGDDDNDQAEQYINYQYSYNGVVNSGGLACADIWHTACVGFPHDEYNDGNILLKLIVPNNDKEYDINIANISHKDHISDHTAFLQQFIHSSQTTDEILILAEKTNDFFIFSAQFDQHARNQLDEHYLNNLHLLKSLDKILRSVKNTPESGIGKPELLKNNFAGWSSRRITDEHRLIYKLETETLIIKSCFGHYDDL